MNSNICFITIRFFAVNIMLTMLFIKLSKISRRVFVKNEVFQLLWSLQAFSGKRMIVFGDILIIGPISENCESLYYNLFPISIYNMAFVLIVGQTWVMFNWFNLAEKPHQRK